MRPVFLHRVMHLLVAPPLVFPSAFKRDPAARRSGHCKTRPLENGRDGEVFRLQRARTVRMRIRLEVQTDLFSFNVIEFEVNRMKVWTGKLEESRAVCRTSAGKCYLRLALARKSIWYNLDLDRLVRE